MEMVEDNSGGGTNQYIKVNFLQREYRVWVVEMGRGGGGAKSPGPGLKGAQKKNSGYEGMLYRHWYLCYVSRQGESKTYRCTE